MPIAEEDVEVGPSCLFMCETSESPSRIPKSFEFPLRPQSNITAPTNVTCSFSYVLQIRSNSPLDAKSSSTVDLYWNSGITFVKTRKVTLRHDKRVGR